MNLFNYRLIVKPTGQSLSLPMKITSDILKLRSRTDLKVTWSKLNTRFFRNYLYIFFLKNNNKQAVFCRVGSWPVCQSPPSCMLPWRRRRGPRRRCQRLRRPCCLCSPWLCCCFCASSKRSEGWRERTGPARRSGSRRERRGPKNPGCRCRCPKKNASYDPLLWDTELIQAPSFPHLDVRFLFCTRIRLDWTSSFEAYNTRKICIIRLPAVLRYHNKY